MCYLWKVILFKFTYNGFILIIFGLLVIGNNSNAAADN